MRFLTTLLIFLISGISTFANQDSTLSDTNCWAFRLTPYLVGTMMNGDLTVHNQTATMDVGFDDILYNLEFGAMLHFIASKGNWSIGLDAVYMGLGQTTDKPSAYIQMDQWLGELNLGYAVLPWFHALVGGRYNNLNTEIEFHTQQTREKSGMVDWIDPIIGVRVTPKLGEDWTLLGRADIGGFGITSNLTWQLAAYIDYRASKLISVIVGYRAISNDYETGSDNQIFRYDMVVSGPAFGVSFAF